MSFVKYCIIPGQFKFRRFVSVVFVLCTLLIAWAVSAGELVELYVNPAAINADDDNSGTSDEPLLTINAATRRATELNGVGTPVRIVVAPGVYREHVGLYGSTNQTEAAIIIEAAVPSESIISGSDRWVYWTRLGDEPVYFHAWSYDWGLTPYPTGWENLTLDDIVRRREMVFINGQSMQQVLGFDQLTDSTFWVDEIANLIYIHPPAGITLGASEDALVEVSARDRVLTIERIQNVSVRGFVFQHGSSSLQSAAVSFNNVSNLIFEDNHIIWNNWQGMGMFRVTNATLRRNVMNYNGGAGFVSFQSSDIYSEDDEASFNNWRGVQGGFTGWSVAGQKHLNLHGGTFIRLRAVHNQTRAFWLDNDVTDVTITEAYWCDNRDDGAFIENTPGPVVVRDSVICRNGRTGIVVGNAENLTFEGNVFYANRDSQIAITGRSEGRISTDWITGEDTLLAAGANWVIRDNIIVGMDENHLLFSTSLPRDAWDAFLSTLESDGNTWYNPTNEQVFKPSGNDRVTFAEWQQQTRQDAQSQFAAPPDWVDAMLQFRNS